MDQQFHREYHALYKVIVTDPLEPELSILLCGLIPLPNSPHWFDSQALAQKPEVSIPDQEDAYLRHVSVTWSTKTVDPSRQNQDKNESPLGQPPTVRWGHVNGTRLFTVTADNSPVKIVNGSGSVLANATIPGAVAGETTPVQTSAGEQFEPAPEIEERRLTLSVTRLIANYDPDAAFRFLDTTNSGDISLSGALFTAGTVRCVQNDGERAGQQKGISLWTQTLGFEFSENWDLDLRDCGTYSLSQDGQYRRVPASLPNGLGTRVNMNGAGSPISPNDPPLYLRFRRFPRKDYALLNLVNL